MSDTPKYYVTQYEDGRLGSWFYNPFPASEYAKFLSGENPGKKIYVYRLVMEEFFCKEIDPRIKLIDECRALVGKNACQLDSNLLELKQLILSEKKT